MTEAYQTGATATGNSFPQQSPTMQQAQQYGQQAQQYGQQAQQYGQPGQQYGQPGGNMVQNHGQAFNQNPTQETTSNAQNYNQGSENRMTNENHAMNSNHAPGQNSNQDYYNQKPNEMNSQEPTYQQGNAGMNGQAGQSGAQYPNSKAPDTLHVWLDKIEKKFGGDRFDETKHPENAAKNAALNENIIKKLKQVMQIVMQRGPQMAMQYGSKLF